MASTLQNTTTTLKLNTGASLPILGLGTWRATDDQEGYNAVKSALEAGYRHIDTAAIYQNEEVVGRAIRESGIPRDEIFVTTKLWGTQHRDPAAALDQSLERLGLDYVDLYLMHWPVPMEAKYSKSSSLLEFPYRPDGSLAVESDWDFIKTWELMQELPKTKTRAIGVSNFSINNINDLLKSPGNKIVPAANQVELHPLLPQAELVTFCQEKGIVVEAYSPFGSVSAPLLSEQAIIEVAKKHDVSAAQVILSWHIKRGIAVLPKSVHKERVVSNFKTFSLPEDDFATINNVSKEKGEKRVVNFDWSPFKIFE
ncbi:hypothetical protein KAFR_0E03850 [Kazachstania africana CBS 2517]|uniref:NADP-dependent oxidoreductase domain-containing protein n=1 Tax=Kazachstania africana (strain ATCC 22294 / BCRC 22015 / CBS 2517 / CECT 1963 / NBRC 1671 / NRRL Y-8276) TaxID=1071382 RepID=H2AVY6_KAZAF|nr:hypothetical protein KAFR_0E03850 [Kazachstania africana CBS 2517]CCF58536.1 hypothetical protein KAFR_0E03850 [Kazachstania africana CBS 2517]